MGLMVLTGRTGRQIPNSRRLLTLPAVVLCLFVLSPFLSAAFAAPAAGAAGGGQGRYIVGFERGIRTLDTRALAAANAQVHRRFHLVRAVSASMSPQAAARLAANPSVAYVEPDLKVRALAQDVPWGITRIGAPLIHAAGNTGTGVKVAIIDTGIDYTHPDLATNYAGGYDFVNDDTDPMDDNGHGTHCAGTVAAVNNSEGVIGVAPGVSLYGLKMLDAGGEGDLSDGIAALEWCVDNDIDVVSMSWGASDEPLSEALREACASAYANGLVLVAAAGNDGPGTDTVNQPAYFDSVIAVAAVDQTDSWAFFSSTGPAVEVAAPGVDIMSTWPSSGYESYEGTSMACPHVSGVVALVIASGITDPAAVRERIQQTAQDLGTPGRDEYFGYGLVRADWAAGDSDVIVTGVTPKLGTNSEVVSATISGLGFQSGATVVLAKSGQFPIFGTGVTVVSDTQITCSLSLLGATGGVWDVAVINADTSSGVLPEGFYVMGAVDEDFETGDFSRWSWLTSGDADWSVSSAESHTGTFAARAGSMTAGGSSVLEITLACGAGDISFFKKLNCPAGLLAFYVDGEAISEWTGVTDWDTLPLEYAVAAGTHTFKWEYWDLLGDSTGTVWLDDINFPPVSGEHTVSISSGPTGTPSPVGPNSAVTCGVNAYDTLGHDLIYAWSAEGDAGSFDNTATRNPIWTAPATPGDYRITVTVTCSQDATINETASYTQTVAEFIVSAITPDSGVNDQVASVTIDGLGFESGATAQLTKPGHSPIAGTGVTVVSANQITCDFNLNGAAEGAWNVVVTNPSSDTATLYAGFTVIGAVDEDFETGDFSRWPWSTYGDVKWTVSSTDARTGVYAARAGSMSSTGSSFLEITLDCAAGDISFHRRLSCAGGLLIFYVDGDAIGEWSGISDWDTSPITYGVTAGSHTFKWEYWDVVGDPPSTVWLDDMTFPPVAGQHSLVISSGPAGTPNPVSSGGNVACTVAATDSLGHGLSYQWSAEGGAGSFDDATLAAPTWTAPANTSGSSQDYEISVTVTCNGTPSLNKTASFTQTVNTLAQYQLTLNDAACGSVIVDGTPHDLPWQGTFDEGTDVTIEAVPIEGWIHDQFSGDVPDGHAQDNPMTVTMDQDRTIKTHFKRDICTLTIGWAGAGTVSIDGTPQSLPYTGQFQIGTVVNIDVTPKDGWQFQVWSGDVPDGDKTSDPLSLTMNQGRSINPHFMVIKKELTVSWAGAGTVSINGTPRSLPYTGMFPVNRTVDIDALPNSGWEFDRWSGDVAVADRTDAPLALTMDQDCTINPHFKRVKRTLTIEWAGAGTVLIDGTPQALPYTGSFPTGTVVSIDAVPKSGWEFQKWTGDVVAADATDDPVDLTMNQDRTIRPNFMRIKRTLTIQWAGAGTVTVNGTPRALPFVGAFPINSVVTVDAIPKPGYIFDQWTGEYPAGGRFSDPLAITMDADRTIKPCFKSDGAAPTQLMSVSALPTAGGAEICFTLSAPASVSAEVLNIAGRTVKHIVTDRLCESGAQSLAWNGYSDLGTRVPHGSYLVRVSVFGEDGQQSERITTVQVR